MKAILMYLVARGREPSTYAGLGMLLAAFHVADASSWAHVIATAAMGITGVAAMAMKEAGIQ